MYIYKNGTRARFVVHGAGGGVGLVVEPNANSFDSPATDVAGDDYVTVVRRYRQTPVPEPLDGVRWIVSASVAAYHTALGRTDFVYLGEEIELSAAERQDLPAAFADAPVYNGLIRPV